MYIISRKTYIGPDLGRQADMKSYRTYSDPELSGLLRVGDQLAYTEIYERYFDLLYLHALKRVGDPEAAKDLIQELFTALWLKRDVQHVQSNLSHYLYTATRNAVFNFIARQKLESKYISQLPDLDRTGECFTDHLARMNQLTLIIEKEINELPEKMRIVFLLSRQDGLSHKEIADKLGLSELTVKTQVKNALRILHGKLGLVLYLVLLFR